MVGETFVAVSSSCDLHSADSENPTLSSLRATALPAPTPDEFWFAAWAQVIEQSPPTAAMRVYAFDGKVFRTIWAAKDFLTESDLGKAVELTTGGFVLTKLFDPTGNHPHSPGIVIHEQYALTPDGPLKVTEWRTDRQ